jgi:hypothetical protein
MGKYFEVVVGLVTSIQKNGKEKSVKEAYLVDAHSVTEAESKVVEDFENSGVQLDYKVISARESKVVRVIG